MSKVATIFTDLDHNNRLDGNILKQLADEIEIKIKALGDKKLTFDVSVSDVMTTVYNTDPIVRQAGSIVYEGAYKAGVRQMVALFVQQYIGTNYPDFSMVKIEDTHKPEAVENEETVSTDEGFVIYISRD